jgi:hypothetical protein
LPLQLIWNYDLSLYFDYKKSLWWLSFGLPRNLMLLLSSVFYTIVIAAGPTLILGSPLLMFLLISGHCWPGNRIWHSSYKSKWSFFRHFCVPNASDKLIVIHSTHGVDLFLQILRFYASLFNSCWTKTCLVQLFPDCAPHSVAYILELLTLRHCAGCQFYRAEGRGQLWDLEGNHIKKVSSLTVMRVLLFAL